MLTIFTVAKPFRGKFAVIQRNAIASWARLRPSCQILLLGNEEGLAEAAAETGATHVPELARNEFGTPLLSGVFSEAERRARFEHLCYVNADILLLGDFLPAVQRVRTWNSRSLVVGRRWNLEVSESLTWEAGWEDLLRARLRTEGTLEAPSGIDYFVFQRGLWGPIPALTIGRGFWDNWLIFRARALGAPVVDATKWLTAIHQNHDYSHHRDGKAGVWSGPESQRNYDLGGGLKNACTLRDATHRLTSKGVSRRFISFDFHRCLVYPIASQKWVKPLVRLKKALLQGSSLQAPKET